MVGFGSDTIDGGPRAGAGRFADRIAHCHGVVAVGERRVRGVLGRTTGGDVAIHGGEQGTERVGVPLDVPRRIAGGRDAGRAS